MLANQIAGLIADLAYQTAKYAIEADKGAETREAYNDYEEALKNLTKFLKEGKKE